MPHRVLKAAVVAGVLVVTTRSVNADPVPMPSPNLRLSGDSVLVAPSGSYLLPTGSRILSPQAWETLDVEVRRLQDAEVRLTAENESFRASASSWSPGWRTIALTLAVGIAGGVYVASRF